MPYKDSWGEQAKARGRKRSAYFIKYRRDRAKLQTAARTKVHNAVRLGKLKPKACEHFNEECRGRTEAHHPDHSKPLEVVWLCSHHHRVEESKLKEQVVGTKNCLHCGTEIRPPKNKYCSDKCNLADWRKKKKVVK